MSHRSVTVEETWGRLQPLLGRIPVTRVYDVGLVDYLDLPVWSAVTPLAVDLTVHSGRGVTAAAAKVSAVMEAVERVSAESTPANATITLAIDEVARITGVAALDPADFDLPFESSYHRDRRIRWAIASDLLSGDRVYVARDLAVTPAADGVTVGVETNGLGADNTFAEASRHAVLEVIERDATAQEAYYAANYDPSEVRRPVQTLDLATVPYPARGWVEHLRGAGLHVAVQDVTAEDLGIPVFKATIGDPDFPGADGEIVYFGGCGVGLDAADALLQALTEATQSHSISFLGARDTIEGLTSVARAATLNRQADVVFGNPELTWSYCGADPDGIDAELSEIAARLRGAGFERCVLVDLTRADLGIPVVRALIPGMCHVYPESNRRPNMRLIGQIL